MNGLKDVVHNIQWNTTQSLKDGILPFAITCGWTWRFSKSAISQTEKDKYSMISLLCGIQKITAN